ncbi:hypothetical protein R1sor_002255 [Riccia sorocarpa]|uniref:SAP domain-containing protein n=1 Tax=Riccia sorocarpa TaxID=122646 RepID=A0ABD3GZ30_9MARC
MTRPPRPRYPSDTKNYHDARRPGCPHTIRLPEELLDTYVALKRALGAKTSHADVIRFLFEAADAAITSVVQAAEPVVCQDSQNVEEPGEIGECSMGVMEDPGAESPGESEGEDTLDDGPDVWDFTAPEFDNILSRDSQAARSFGEAELQFLPDATYGFWSKQKKMLHQELLQAGKPLVVYVDCRFDSSRSGFHGTLPVINKDDDKVIEMVTLTRHQTGSSWKIETQVLEVALKTLADAGLTIEEVIHDDNSQVDSILAAHSIMSSRDLWHKCKNVMGKFKEVLQDKRRSPSDSAVENATTIAAVAVFTLQQLRDFCKDNEIQSAGNKLQLVQRVSVFLNLPEAGATSEIQRTRPLRYPELAQHDLAYKLKSWIYTCAKNAAVRGDTDPKVLTLDIQNAADHWAGQHDTCRTLPGTRKCVTDNWTSANERKYDEGGETHKAVKAFLKKYITETKMKYYLRARENYMSETFHSVINKYATKRIHFDASHTARLACSAMDWNENVRQEVRAVYQRSGNDTSVRRRARTNKVLVNRTSVWKQNLARRVFG